MHGAFGLALHRKLIPRLWTLTTALISDAAQGKVNYNDAVVAIMTFQDPAAFNATHVSVTDVHPNLSGTQINKTVNFDDVFVEIPGFQGFEYPGPQIELCADP